MSNSILSLRKKRDDFFSLLKRETGETEQAFFVYFFVGCFAFLCLKVLWKIPLDFFPYTLLLMSPSLLFMWPVKSGDVIKPIKVLLYPILTLCAVYIWLSPPYLPSDDLLLLRHSAPFVWGILRCAGPVALLLWVLSLWRPCMGIYLLILMSFYKMALSYSGGVPLSETDWLILVEGGCFLLILLSLSKASPFFLQKFSLMPKRWRAVLDNVQSDRLQFYFLITIVCIHFGNYFYSGLGKTGLFSSPVNASGVLDWLWNNATYYLVLNTWYSGHLPLAAIKGAPQAAYETLRFFVLPMNFIVLATQLICLFCVFRVAFIKYITIFYDVMHVAIFLTSGIFFWKWIIFNTALATALHRHKAFHIPKSIGLFFMFVVLASPSLFFIARLAWFDTRSFNNAYFEAVDAQGQSYKVPTNYFGPMSVTFAQGRVGRNFKGFFGTGTFGNNYDHSQTALANKCLLPVDTDVKGLTTEAYDQISSFIKRHHRYVLENVGPSGRIAYDVYPHHIWSNPALYSDFYALDKRTIVTYSYTIEAVCLDDKGNDLQVVPKKRERYDISVM